MKELLGYCWCSINLGPPAPRSRQRRGPGGRPRDVLGEPVAATGAREAQGPGRTSDAERHDRGVELTVLRGRMLQLDLDQTACTEIVGFRKGGEVYFSRLCVQELREATVAIEIPHYVLGGGA